MALDERIRASWRIEPDLCEPLPGGMTSRTWAVTAAGERYVAKLVPPDHRGGFTAGLAAAEHLASAGIATGAPVRTADGGLVVILDDGVLGLLRYVPGRSLDRTDQRAWGSLLGAVHRGLDGFAHPGFTRWHWVRLDALHLGLEPWLRPAVVAAVEALAAMEGLTHGVLHGDPSPDAFLLDDSTGRAALIDWGSACAGPLVYDLASAVMYAGGPARSTELLDAYAAAGPLSRTEIDAALPTLLRFRYAVQADWFARRIEVDDRTGIADPAENWAGLHHARRMFATGS